MRKLGRPRRILASRVVAALTVGASLWAASSPPASAEVAPTNWTQLGGIITSDPAVVALNGSQALHFARGSDGALWRYSDGVDDGLNAGGWASLGGGLIGAPAAVRTSAGIELFIHGLDHAMWHRTLGPSGWSEWESLGGILTSDPTAWNRSWDPSAEDVRVFVRGNDGATWHRGRVGGAWQGWASIGGIAVGSPAAAQGSVVVRGTDDRVWLSTAGPASFSQWTPIPNGRVSSDPAITTAGDLMIWAKGLDGAIWRMRYDRFAGPPPGTSGPSNTYQWSSLGGQLIGGPGATCVPLTQVPANQIAVVDIRGADGALWTIRGGTSSYFEPECS